MNQQDEYTVEELRSYFYYDEVAEVLKWRKDSRLVLTYQLRPRGWKARSVAAPTAVWALTRGELPAGKLWALSAGSWAKDDLYLLPKAGAHITQKLLHEYFNYDGRNLVVRKPTGPHQEIGGLAGYLDGYGYRMVSIAGKSLGEHRLVWLFVHGAEVPTDLALDHVDGNPANNAIANLRLATKQQNAFNTLKPRNNTSGYKGVSFQKLSGKYMAHTALKGKHKYLGLYPTALEASQAYEAYAKVHHGEFYRAPEAATA